MKELWPDIGPLEGVFPVQILRHNQRFLESLGFEASVLLAKRNAPSFQLLVKAASEFSYCLVIVEHKATEPYPCNVVGREGRSYTCLNEKEFLDALRTEFHSPETIRLLAMIKGGVL